MTTKAQLDTSPRFLGVVALLGAFGCANHIREKQPDPAPEPGPTPCADDEREFASESTCAEAGLSCHRVDDVWCGVEVVDCCAAEPTCEPHQLGYGDEEACSEAGQTCQEVSVCCGTIWCAEDASALAAELSFTDREVNLTFTGGEGLSIITCGQAFRLQKAGAEPGEYVDLVDQRPWDTNGAYVLDGVPHEEVFAGEGCDVLDCVPLADAELSRVEYVSLTEAAAPDADEADPEPVVPELVTRVVTGPVRVVVQVYADPGCNSSPVVRTFDSIAP